MMKFEDKLEYCSYLRFDGGSMLINRTIVEFAQFVSNGIFTEDSDEHIFITAYGGTFDCKDEADRASRWCDLFVLFCEQQYAPDKEYKGVKIDG